MEGLVEKKTTLVFAEYRVKLLLTMPMLLQKTKLVYIVTNYSITCCVSD